MRSYDAPTLSYLQSRGGVAATVLIWVEAKNRATGLPETMGLSTAADDAQYTIGSEGRLYRGAGALIGVPPITMQVGLAVRMHRFSLAPLSPEVVELIQLYDARFAPVEIHRAFHDPLTRQLMAEPHRVFKGYIDGLEIVLPEVGGEARCEVTVASSARNLTRTLALKRSDGTQQLRGGDRFLRYADVSGEVDVFWGTRRTVEKAPMSWNPKTWKPT